MSQPSRASLGLALAIMAVAGYGIWSALAWPLKAKLFPLVISVPLFLLAAAEAAWVLFAKEHAPAEEPASTPAEATSRRTLAAAAWAIGFFGAIILLGFVIAVPLLLVLYLRFQGREGWTFTLVFSAVVSAAFWGLFDVLLHLPFPAGWLVSLLGLG